MGATLVQRLVGDVLVVVRSAALPLTNEVDDQIRQAASVLDRTRVVVVAVVGDGREFQFDFELRARLCSAGLFSKPHALLAPPLRPELVATLKWVGAEVHSFGPDALDEACDLLAIAPSVRSELREAIDTLKRQVNAPIARATPSRIRGRHAPERRARQAKCAGEVRAPKASP
jgi:hypothetical protein